MPWIDDFPRWLASVSMVALLAACGGNSGDVPAGTPGTPDTPITPPAPAPGTVSGTAAAGAPLANLPVTLKDSANRSVAATTSSTGAFTLDTTGLTPPFLLQLTTPGGARLLSVSTDGNRTATLNITPLTDLLVRSWYRLQGQSVDAAFADPRALPAPAPGQLLAIARELARHLQLAIRASDAPVAQPLDLVAKPFAADGRGLDRLLELSAVTIGSSGAELVVRAGAVTQSTAFSFDPAAGAITALSNATSGAQGSATRSTAVVPLQGEQVKALEDIDALLLALANVVNARRPVLAAADFEPYFAADLLHSGMNRAQYLAGLADQLRASDATAVTLERINVLDPAAGRAELLLRVGSRPGQMVFHLRKGAGGWQFAGDDRIAELTVLAEARRTYRDPGGLCRSPAANCPTNFGAPAVLLDVRAPTGTVVSASATSTFALQPFAQYPAQVRAPGVFDVFLASTSLAAPLPQPGTPVTVTLQQAGGGSASSTVPLNAFTTELIEITSPGGFSPIPAGATSLSWTLPTTYLVERIELLARAYTDDSSARFGFECVVSAGFVAPTATSGVVNVPRTCNGLPVRTVNLDLGINGANGERSRAVYNLNLRP